MSILSELFMFLMSRKKYWLMPVIIVSIILGTFLFLAQSSAVAPFIYSLF
jgi:hypothetical protein